MNEKISTLQTQEDEFAEEETRPPSRSSHGGNVTQSNNRGPKSPIAIQRNDNSQALDEWHITYRLRGIPSDLDADPLSDILANLFQLENSDFEIHSLATDITNKQRSFCRTATISFQESPGLLRNKKDQLSADGVIIPYALMGSKKSLRFVFDTHFSKFTPLSSWKNDPKHEITCIFIHGWGGHAIGSFRSAFDSNVWPRDSLPHDSPELRVWTYGYGSKLTDSRSHEDPYTYAAEFKDDFTLLQKRTGATELSTPSIFIVHSLGGLVFKRSLARMYASNEPDDKINLRSIYGALFFGVPGQGMDVTALATMVEGTPHEYTVDLLNQNMGFQLRNDEQEDFSRAFGYMDSGLTYFFERKESKTVIKDLLTGKFTRDGPEALLVPEVSATYGRSWKEGPGRIRPLGKDHFGLVKFSKHDEDYSIVAGVVQSFSEKAVKIIPQRTQRQEEMEKSRPSSQAEQASLQSLFFREMAHRGKEIQEAVSDTCTWILKDPTFEAWSVRTFGMLWIKGKPGAGKSTLMKQIFETASNEGRNSSIILSFFFHGRGQVLQRSEIGLLRSLLYQLAQKIPEILSKVAREFTTRCEKYGKYEEKWVWEADDLKDFIKASVVEVAKTQHIRIYVDALDECGESAAVNLVQFFQDIRDSFKICFSCRHFPIIALGDGGLDICVEDHNSKDIETYVDYQMRTSLQAHERAKFGPVRDQIICKASGVFQWVKLVTDKVLNLKRRNKDIKAIQKEVETLPSALEDLYHQLLGSLDEYDKSQTLKLVQWISFALRPLSLMELRVAMAIDSSPEYGQLAQVEENEEYAKTESAMRARVLDLSRGLVEFVTHDETPTAQFIHQSVNDYLRERGFELLDDSKNWAPSGSFTGRSHFRLSRSCIRYLWMEEVEGFDLAPMARMHKSPTRELMRIGTAKEFPLFLYAAFNWVWHSKQVEAAGLSQEDLIPLYNTYPPLPLDHNQICRYSWTARKWQLFRPKFTSIAHVAARYGLLSILLALIAQGVNIELRDRLRSTPFSMAVTYNHEKMVRVLLRYSWIDVNSRENDNRTPLYQAAINGKEEIVRLLLQQDRVEKDPREGSSGRTPLSWAADVGNVSVIKLLLAETGVDNNSRDLVGRTPLSWAAGEGRAKAVRVLLDQEDVDINIEDDSGRSALSWAVEAGHQSIVEMLSNEDRVQHNRKETAVVEGIVPGLVRSLRNYLYM